jgi:ComF family protein
MLNNLIQLLFPRHCAGCATTLSGQEGTVCLECLLEMPQTGFHTSPRDNPLYFRLAGRVALEGASALYYFDKHGRLKNVVSSLKYRRNPRVGRDLGLHFGQVIKGFPMLSGVDAIVPVPLHPRRLAERGYNQSTALAQGLAKALSIPVLEHSLLRVQNTKTQTKKGKNERWENVESAFEIKGELPGHIALVDDVITTGATTEACIKELQRKANVKVTLLALAIAR